MVYDGTGAAGAEMDVGILGDRIVAVAAGLPERGTVELDARGLAVAPGFIETPILSTIPEKVIQMLEDKVPLGRLGRAEEIANTYAWLASDEASYVTGAVLEVSGGVTI
jgi:3-oxoacyl-[acyl-carrier protein] reductase